MAQLTVDQVKVPDFSASSEMLARANQSFVSGLDSAKGILAAYDTGQKTKNDNEILNAFAKAGSVEEFEGILSSDILLGKNISDDMKKYVAGLRTELIGNDATMAGTDSTRAATSRANAQEGRTAAEYEYTTGQRAALASVTPLALAAEREGRGNGSAVVYANDGKTRNDPLSSTMEETLNSVLPTLGLGFKVTSGGQETAEEVAAGKGSRTGAKNHDHGGAGDGYFYDLQTGEKIDPNKDPRAWDAITELTAAGVGGIGHGEGYMGEGMFHIGNTGGDRIWGATHSKDSADPRLKAAWEKGLAKRNGQPVTTVGTGGEASRALETALGTLNLPPDVALGIMRGDFEAQKIGNADIAAAEALRQQEAIAAGQISNLQNPEITTQAGMQAAGLAIPGISPTNQLAAGVQAGQIAEQFPELLAPTVAENPLLTQSNAAQAAEEARGMGLDPTIAAFETAKAFESSGDVGGELLNQFNLPNEGVTTKANINREVSKFAEANGLTEGEAATVFASMTENGIRMEDMLTASADTELYGLLKQRAGEMFSPEARTAAEDKAAADLNSKVRRDSIEGEILKTKTEAAKLPAGTTERAEAEQKVRMLETAQIAANQPEKAKAATQDYLAQRVDGFDPSMLVGLTSEEAKAFEATIRADDSLSEEQKMLLILGLRV